MHAPRNRYQDLRPAAQAATDVADTDESLPPLRKEQSSAPGSARLNDDTNILPWMAEAFAELTRAQFTDAPFILRSCFVNGQPTAVIGFVQEVDDEAARALVTPLFVAVTRDMVMTDHQGRKAW